MQDGKLPIALRAQLSACHVHVVHLDTHLKRQLLKPHYSYNSGKLRRLNTHYKLLPVLLHVFVGRHGDGHGLLVAVVIARLR